MNTVEIAHCRNRPRQRSQSTHLGCSKYAIISDPDEGRFYRHRNMLYLPSQIHNGRFRLCRQCQPVQHDSKANGDQVVQHLQKSINMWAGLLRATGGALVPEKCFWYYIHNTWKNGKWQYVSTPTTHVMLVPDDNNAPIPIPELNPSEARCTLGV